MQYTDRDMEAAAYGHEARLGARKESAQNNRCVHHVGHHFMCMSRVMGSQLELECRLWKTVYITLVVFKFHAVFKAGFNQTKPAKIDNDAVIDVFRDGSVLERVPVDLTMPRVFFCDWNVNLQTVGNHCCFVALMNAAFSYLRC